MYDTLLPILNKDTEKDFNDMVNLIMDLQPVCERHDMYNVIQSIIKTVGKSQLDALPPYLNLFFTCLKTESSVFVDELLPDTKPESYELYQRNKKAIDDFIKTLLQYADQYPSETVLCIRKMRDWCQEVVSGEFFIVSISTSQYDWMTQLIFADSKPSINVDNGTYTHYHVRKETQLLLYEIINRDRKNRVLVNLYGKDEDDIGLIEIQRDIDISSDGDMMFKKMLNDINSNDDVNLYNNSDTSDESPQYNSSSRDYILFDHLKKFIINTGPTCVNKILRQVSLPNSYNTNVLSEYFEIVIAMCSIFKEFCQYYLNLLNHLVEWYEMCNQYHNRLYNFHKSSNYIIDRNRLSIIRLIEYLMNQTSESGIRKLLQVSKTVESPNNMNASEASTSNISNIKFNQKGTMNRTNIHRLSDSFIVTDPNNQFVLYTDTLISSILTLILLCGELNSEILETEAQTMQWTLCPMILRFAGHYPVTLYYWEQLLMKLNSQTGTDQQHINISNRESSFRMAVFSSLFSLPPHLCNDAQKINTHFRIAPLIMNSDKLKLDFILNHDKRISALNLLNHINDDLSKWTTSDYSKVDPLLQLQMWCSVLQCLKSHSVNSTNNSNSNESVDEHFNELRHSAQNIDWRKLKEFVGRIRQQVSHCRNDEIFKSNRITQCQKFIDQIGQHLN